MDFLEQHARQPWRFCFSMIIESSPKDKEILDNLNVFMSLILPDINAGLTLNIEKYAAVAGLDVEAAQDLVKNLLKKFDNLDRRKG